MILHYYSPMLVWINIRKVVTERKALNQNPCQFFRNFSHRQMFHFTYHPVVPGTLSIAISPWFPGPPVSDGPIWGPDIFDWTVFLTTVRPFLPELLIHSTPWQNWSVLLILKNVFVLVVNIMIWTMLERTGIHGPIMDQCRTHWDQFVGGAPHDSVTLGLGLLHIRVWRFV